MSQHVFLLSPANLSGTRAKQLASPRATFDAAQRYRSAEGVPIGQAFAFMSALYFRGKITYAQHFAELENVFVITSGFGLVAPEWRMNEERLTIMAKTPVDAAWHGYRKPLERDALAVADRLDAAAHVVLVRRHPPADLRPAATLPRSFRRPRRHVPRRPDAPSRAREPGAGVRHTRCAASPRARSVGEDAATGLTTETRL